jgi:hypothetical protein
MKQLHAYLDFVKQVGWESEKIKIVEQAKRMIHKQVSFALTSDKFREPAISRFEESLLLGSMLLPMNVPVAIQHLGDLKILVELKYNQTNSRTDYGAITTKPWCDECNEEAIPYRGNYSWECNRGCGRYWVLETTEDCPKCENKDYSKSLDVDKQCVECGCSWTVFHPSPVFDFEYKDGRFGPVPGGKGKARRFNRDWIIEVPKTLDDPKHFGHVIWEFTRLLESCETD